MKTGYTAAETKLPRQVRKYLEQHGVWLTWHFHEDHPPTREVKDYIQEIADTLFDLSEAEEIVVDRAIDLMKYLIRND